MAERSDDTALGDLWISPACESGVAGALALCRHTPKLHNLWHSVLRNSVKVTSRFFRASAPSRVPNGYGRGAHVTRFAWARCPCYPIRMGRMPMLLDPHGRDAHVTRAAWARCPCYSIRMGGMPMLPGSHGQDAHVTRSGMGGALMLLERMGGVPGYLVRLRGWGGNEGGGDRGAIRGWFRGKGGGTWRCLFQRDGWTPP